VQLSAVVPATAPTGVVCAPFPVPVPLPAGLLPVPLTAWDWLRQSASRHRYVAFVRYVVLRAPDGDARQSAARSATVAGAWKILPGAIRGPDPHWQSDRGCVRAG